LIKTNNHLTRLLAVLVLVVALIVVGCGGKNNNQGSQNKINDTSQQQTLAENQQPEKNQQSAPTATEQPVDKTGVDQQRPVTQADNNAQAHNAAPVVAASVFTIEGSGIVKTTQLSLSDLQGMSIIQEQYFSLNNWGTKKYFSFKGVSLWEILNKAGVKDSAQQVVISAEDGYSVAYSIADVKKDDYIDEQNPAKKYKMIIAWEEDGKAYDTTQYPFRLVVGQKAPGDINKPNWVEKIKTIKVD